MDFDDDEGEKDILVRIGTNENYKQMIFNRRFALIEAMERYKQEDNRGAKASNHFIISRVESFFLEANIFLISALNKNKKLYDEIVNLVDNAKTYKEVRKVMLMIDKVLYDYNILTNESEYAGVFGNGWDYQKDSKGNEEYFEK